MTRWPQIVLIGSTLLGSWLGMQAVHELGHVAGAWLTGGRVERVVLDPRTISRTDLAHNPRPLVVVWTGPILGVAAPLLLCGIFVATRRGSARVSRPRRFADHRSPGPQGDVSAPGDLRLDERGSVGRPVTTGVLPGAFVLRFFAGFCLVANGLYIGAGSFGGIGDCGEMLRHGAAAWHEAREARGHPLFLR